MGDPARLKHCLISLYKFARGPALKAIKLSPYEQNGAETIGSLLLSVVSFVSRLSIYGYPIYLSLQVAFSRINIGLALRNTANFGVILLSVYCLSYGLLGFGRYWNPNYSKFYPYFVRIQGHPIYKDYIFDLSYADSDYVLKEPAKVLRAKNSGLNIIYSMIARFFTDNIAIFLTYPGASEFVKNVELPIDLYSYNLKLRDIPRSIEQMTEYIIEIPDNIKLNLFHFKSRMNSTQNLVVYFTGNGENSMKTQRHSEFTELGYDFVVYDRPGYGISSGRPIPQNEANSVLAVMKFVTEKLKYKTENIIVYGWSIGGFSASIAYHHFPNLKGVILDATFDSIAHFGVSLFPELLHSILEYTVNHHFPLVLLPYFEDFEKFSSYLNVMIIIREKDEVMSQISAPDRPPLLENSVTVKLAIEMIKMIYKENFDNNESLRKLRNVLQNPKLIQKAIYAEKKNFLEQCITNHLVSIDLTHSQAMELKDLKYVLEQIEKNHKKSMNSFSL